MIEVFERWYKIDRGEWRGGMYSECRRESEFLGGFDGMFVLMLVVLLGCWVGECRIGVVLGLGV